MYRVHVLCNMYRVYVLCILIHLLGCYTGDYCNTTQIPEHIINTPLYYYNKKKSQAGWHETKLYNNGRTI